MKFKLDMEKKNATNASQAQGHNERLHPTQHQLPKSEWFTPQGSYVLKKWDADLMAKSKELAKRKDAVFAVELVFQVGNQADWRDPPTPEHPCGKPKAGSSKRMNDLIAGVKAAALEEFGKERIISMALHTDESTPHVHVVFAPILDGKLNAKHWTGGALACAKLRERLHSTLTKYSPCEYTKGAKNGEAHDPLKAAGGPKSPLKNDENLTLKGVIQKLQNQVQTLFSQLKSEQKKAQKVKAENDDFAEKAMRKMQALEAEIAKLRPTPAPNPEKTRQEAENHARRALGVVMGDRKSPPSPPPLRKP